MQIKEEHTKEIEAFVAYAEQERTHDPEELKLIIQRIFDSTEEEIFLRVDTYTNREKMVVALANEGYTVRVLEVKGDEYNEHYEIVFKLKKHSNV